MSRLGVSVVIPTFNGKHLLEKHLSSVLKNVRASDELLIVEDAGSDGTAAYVKQKMTGVERIEPNWHSTSRTANPNQVSVYSGKIDGKMTYLVILEKNARFAVAANTGVALAGNPLVFLINNDVSVRENCVNRLREHFELDGTGSLFAVGCLEIEGESGQAGGRNKLWFGRGLFQHSRAEEYVSGTTAWASGGSAMFSVEKWLELGGFDPRFYPAYWEDVDLSFRAKKMGWRVEFDDSAVVDHQHESTNSTVFGAKKLEKQSFKHQRLFTRIHANLWQRLQYILWWPYWRYTMRKVWS